MDDCIFCKIVKGEIPAYKVYEDDLFFAFLDIRPLTKGNTLVIPKKHYRWVYDVPDFGQYWEVAKKIALATINNLGAERVIFLTLGMEVPHAHIRVIPRFQKDLHGQVPDIDVYENFSQAEMKTIAESIKKTL